jgi:hypothetical protein
MLWCRSFIIALTWNSKSRLTDFNADEDASPLKVKTVLQGSHKIACLMVKKQLR